jgi:hypothetical protein
MRMRAEAWVVVSSSHLVTFSVTHDGIAKFKKFESTNFEK